jgi:hypothetical protein
LIASNSASVIAPLSRSCFAFSISEAAPHACRLTHVVAELLSLGTSQSDVALRHSVVL